MKAIKTTFKGPSNTRGARIIAREPDGKYIIVSWDLELDAEANHKLAARRLAGILGWNGKLVTGWLKDCYVHVFVGRS